MLSDKKGQKQKKEATTEDQITKQKIMLMLHQAVLGWKPLQLMLFLVSPLQCFMVNRNTGIMKTHSMSYF